MAVGIVHTDIQIAVQKQGDIAVGMLPRLGNQREGDPHLRLQHDFQPKENPVHLPRLEGVAGPVRPLRRQGG